MSTQIKNIFSDSACPSQETMFMYVDNLLKGEEKHAFERHLAGCSLCAEALDGLSMMNRSEAVVDIDMLNAQINEQYVKPAGSGYWSWAVAASVSMLLIAGAWAFLHNNAPENLALDIKTKTTVAEKAKEPAVAVKTDSSSFFLQPQADKTIALSNESNVASNVASDAKITTPAVVSAGENDVPELTWSKANEVPAREDVSNQKQKRSQNPANERAGYDTDLSKGAAIDQTRGVNSSDEEKEQMSPASPGISSQMLAFEESILVYNPANDAYKNKDDQGPAAVTNSGASTANKATTSPSQPYMKEEERKKAKTMSGCNNCPDKKMSQAATQDMQELTYSFAVRKFNEKSYSEAHVKFDQFINQDPESAEAYKSRLYDAMCLIYLNQPQEALKRLNQLGSYKELSDDAQWLKAAIFIDQDRPNDAKVLLNDLLKNKTYKEKAAKALKELN
ncbi:MAG: zf-HC2 domain-containing protein [Cytophagaceae bacterium]